MSITTLIHRFRHRTGSKVAAAAMMTVLVVGLTGAPLAFAAGAQASATLQPSRISLDGAAELNVTLRGVGSSDPAAPRVAGLTFTPISQSTSLESINGAATQSVSRIYQVTAAHTGTYTIPAIQFQGARTPQLVLQVLPAQGGAGGASTSQGATLPPPTLGGTTTPSGSAPGPQGAGQAAFVRLLVPKKQLYVGELMPVEIKAYFRSDVGVNLDGPPSLGNDAFTVSNLTANPVQSQESIGGVPYTVLSWFSGVMPIKSGHHTLGPQLPVTLQVHHAPVSLEMPDLDALFGKGVFDDSLFDDSAFQSLLGRVIEKPAKLTASAAVIDVLPLPTTARPVEFSGAVGSFDVQTQETQPRAVVGDPLTVTLHIHGEGNFDRVSSAGIATDAAWKTYRPHASFSPEDNIGLKGTKTFEQIVVPMQAGDVQLPPVEFSYFDPRLREYVVRRTQPFVVAVAPAPKSSGITTANAQAPAGTVAFPEPQGEHTAPIRPVTGSFVPSLSPIVQRSWFFTLPAAPLAMLAGTAFFLRLRNRAVVDRARANDAFETQVAALLAAMDSALQVGDGASFMSAARSALQLRLGQWWSLTPAQVGLREIDARLDSSWDPVRDVFRLADQVAYAGAPLEASSLEHWRQIIRDQLHRVGQS